MHPNSEAIEAIETEVRTINEYATELHTLGPSLLDYVDIGLKLLAVVLLFAIAARI